MENNEFIAQQASKLPQKAKEELLLFMEFLFSKYEVNTTEEKKTIFSNKKKVTKLTLLVHILQEMYYL